MNTFAAQVLGALLRHALGLLGAAGAFSDDEIQRLVGAVLVILSILWSIWQKRQALQPPQPPPPPQLVWGSSKQSVRQYGKRDR